MSSAAVLKKLKAMPSRNPHYKKGQVIAGDRYVSIRSEEQFQLANHLFTTKPGNLLMDSPASKLEREIKLKSMRVKSSDDLNNTVCSYRKVLQPTMAYRKCRPEKVSSAPPKCIKRSRRYVAKSPERILDAPGIVDDFYTSLIDWSYSNIVAVALEDGVYVWNAASESAELLAKFDDEAFPTLVKWSREGRFLSIGLSDGSLKIYDVSKKQCVRTLFTEAHRIACAGWLKNGVVTYGARNGKIFNHDVRQKRSLVATFAGHSREVCGLKWSDDERYLTSGGADGKVNVWERMQVGKDCTAPLLHLAGHTAAVKAIQYVPFLGFGTNIVATGGGTDDNTVRLWNLNNGRLISSQDTFSQVTGILFSNSYKEMITGHGNPYPGVRVWRYNSDGASFEHIADLKKHGGRVHGLCQSPDGSYVMAADDWETMRFWSCWEPDSSIISSQSIGLANVSQLDLAANSSYSSSFCLTDLSTVMSSAAFGVR